MNDKPESEIKLGIVIREGRKVIKRGTINKTIALKGLVDAFSHDVSKAMLAFPTLKRGEKFKYKHRQYSITLEPLVGMTDFY